MTAEIVQLNPETVGDEYRFDPDQVLEDAKGQGFVTLMVLAQNEDGDIWITGNANVGETLVLMERAKHHLVFGDDA
jgi:hypothetical protein